MILFLLYMEPLLLRMEEVTTGVSLASRQVRDVQATEVVGVVKKCERYVDDLQAVSGSLEDIRNISRF